MCAQGVGSVRLWEASLLVAYDGMSAFDVAYCVEWSSGSRCAAWCAGKLRGFTLTEIMATCRALLMLTISRTHLQSVLYMNLDVANHPRIFYEVSVTFSQFHIWCCSLWSRQPVFNLNLLLSARQIQKAICLCG